MDEQQSLPPHVLIFPLPLQGHVNSMFKLAQLLCYSGLHITLLLTENIYNRLVLHSDITSRFDHQFHDLQIKTISDGLHDDHPREGSKFMEVFESLRTKTKMLFKDMLSSYLLCDGWRRRRVGCIIADGILGFTCDVNEEIWCACF
ncbi:putative UDP-glycosyltransferase 85A2-like [Capsicum annuum]|nr:putative UDP-glycosyltransferase 85A2-like [Capsicum annuum]